MSADTPRAWIGCLAAYNAGRLHGEWIDATDVDELNEGRERVLSSSPVPGAEEAFIADYDGFYGLAAELGEYPDYGQLAAIGALLEEHGEPFALMLGTLEMDLAELDADTFYEHYQGEWNSEEAYAQELVSEIGWGGLEQVPDELYAYLDWELIARDLFRHGNYTSAVASNGALHVFEEEV